MPRTKPKRPQKGNKNNVSGRDLFQTPNYAVDLLVPYLPERDIYYIWEPAAGEGKITKRLLATVKRSIIWSTDIRENDFIREPNVKNFLDNNNFYWIDNGLNPIIITNPPFSLKYKFANKALEYDIPFALLIPFDMCQRMARLFQIGCQGLVPTARIDYITPTGLSGATGNTSYFHSFWLTYKFNLPNQLTFVELTKKMREDI